MAELHSTQRPPAEPALYQIRVKGQWGEPCAGWFDGFTARQHEHGETVLTGPVADQAALYGLLKRVRNLGLSLIALSPIDYTEDGEV